VRNDFLIQTFLQDENYRVFPDGTLSTCVSGQGHKTVEWREKPLINKGGYLYITYRKKKLAVHRIVYAKFVGPLNPDLVINHIDGNPSNNQIENLELVTQAENNRHKYRVLKQRPSTGQRLFTFDEAEEIRRLAAEENKRACDLAKSYGVSKGTIHYILKRHTYTFR
jgi:hypothetical protein